jgi:magnesium chelatase subunit D
VDRTGLGGIALARCRATYARGLDRPPARGLPAGAPLRRLPLHIDDERLLGGLDLAATLARRPAGAPAGPAGAGRRRGAAAAHGRAADGAARGAAGVVLDRARSSAARDRHGHAAPARFALVALDDGQADGEALPTVLRERLAMHLIGCLRTAAMNRRTARLDGGACAPGGGARPATTP